VQEEWRCLTLRDRLARLIDGCEAALALPGGPGTLTEIALTWNLLLTESISSRPLILIGPAWQATFEAFFRTFNEYVPLSQRQWLSFTEDEEAAVKELEKRWCSNPDTSSSNTINLQRE
jgi:predicted Rossmann-fold nucleotide-binding protein